MEYIYIRLSIAAVGIMVLTACSSQMEDTTSSVLSNSVAETTDSMKDTKIVTFTASLVDESTSGVGNGSRAALSGSGDTKNVVWQDADEIGVFDKLRNEQAEDEEENVACKLTLSSGEGTTRGTFTGEVSASATNFSALSPWQQYAREGSGSTTAMNVINMVSIPTLQQATEGTYDKSAGLMMGITDKDKMNFEFKNLCHFIKITPTIDCQSITIETVGSNAPYLTGSVNVTYNSGNPTWTAATVTSGGVSMSHKATLVGNITANNTYYIAVLPCTITAGQLRITYNSGEGYKAVAYNKEVTLQRSAYTDFSYVFNGVASSASLKPLFVDLGLTSGTKWATHNLGASSAVDAGTFYSWGEIAGLGEYDAFNYTNSSSYKSNTKAIFNWESYKHGDGSEFDSSSAHMTKYTAIAPSGYDADSKTELEAGDDAACQNWLGTATIPTKVQFEELLKGCYWEYSESYQSSGVKGFIVYKAKDAKDKGMLKSGTAIRDIAESSRTTITATYSVSDTHIFFPFTGFYNNGTTCSSTDMGYYWTKTVYSSNGYYEKAYNLLLRNKVESTTVTAIPELSQDYRAGGQCIRPVAN